MSSLITSGFGGPPFDGSYEQNVEGYTANVPGTGDTLGSAGAIAGERTAAGFNIYLVGNNSNNPWYGLPGSNGQAILLMMDPATPLNFITGMTVTPPGGSPTTYLLSAATLFNGSTSPSGGTDGAGNGIVKIDPYLMWAWPDLNPTPSFVDGQVTTIDWLAGGPSITPSNPSMDYGTSTIFSVSGDDGSGDIWSVNGVLGGDAVNGTISAAGQYVAPTIASAEANGGPFTVEIEVSNADQYPAVLATTTVTFNLPTIQAFGAFRGPNAFRPVSLTNVGSINPKIYAPGENITVKSQS